MSSHVDETAPIPWIGLYIAVASLICTLTMVADLFHGFCSPKFWFPCKYFTLNTATMTVIAIAMKLPVNLTTKMQGGLDNFAKHSGVAFMCVMMANFMPSLGTMDNTDLLLRMIALVILVVTITVDVCIQIGTGIVDPKYAEPIILHIVLMLVLLLLSVSLALNVSSRKRILELQYDEMYKIALDDLQGKINVEKLTLNVSKFLIMAESGNPQLAIVSSPAFIVTSYISLYVSFNQYVDLIHNIRLQYFHYNSDYKWSLRLIVFIQSIGIVVGSIASMCRLYGVYVLKFEPSFKWFENEMMMVFRVENYWLQLLKDWKRSDKALQKIRSSRCKKLAHFAHFFINLILNICIWSQFLVVVTCKIIRLISLIFSFFFYCLVLLKKKLLRSLCAPNTSSVPSGSQPGQDTTETDPIPEYDVQFQGWVEISIRTWESTYNALDRLMKTAEKNVPTHLIPLLMRHSEGLDGVSNFENDEVLPLPLEKAPCCWSLAVVTLTSMAIGLMEEGRNATDFLESIREGLIYVKHVEENLNLGTDLSEARRAANKVWSDVDKDKMWLGESLERVQQFEKPKNFFSWLRNIASDIKSRERQSQVWGFNYKFIAANSMYKISETILSNKAYTIDETSHKTAVEGLKVMISDILCACLTNIPRAITIKCHTGGIEKREKSVRAAAMLLGETKEMLKILEDVEPPGLDPDKMAFLDNWRWRRASQNRQNLVHPVMQSGSEASTNDLE